MSLKFIDGFDQYSGQSGAALLSSLAANGYSVTSNLAVGDSRKGVGGALELRVATGASGNSWSSRTNNVAQDLRGVAVNSNGRAVAVGNAGVAVYSDDSVNWYPLVLGVSANMKGITNHGSTWIAVGDGGAILRSTDGRNFTPRIAPILAANLRSVQWGNGVWVIVGVNGSEGVAFTSSDDGISWGIGITDAATAFNSIEYGNGLWMIAGTAGAVLTSPDAASWTMRNIGVATNVADVRCGTNGHWLAAAAMSVYRSLDGGTTWAVAGNAISTATLTALTELDGRWVAIGNNATVRISDDETTWTTPAFTGASTTPLYDVAPAKGTLVGYIVVGALNVAQPAQTRRAVIYISLAPPTTASHSFNTTASKFVVGFAHRATTRGRILTIDDVLTMDWAGPISIGGNTGTAVPARNVWYYYELEFDRAALTVSLYINNVLDITAPIPGTVTAQTVFNVNWMAENGAVARIDDVYFLDNLFPNGETLVNRLGPIQVPLRLPTADAGPNEWTPASGAQHWTQVGLLPPSPESYIRSASSGKQDLFTSSTPLPPDAGTPTAPILAVGVLALAMKGDIDNRQLGLAVGSGVNQKEVVDTTLSVVPEYSIGIFEQAPGNVAWTAANVVSTPFGVIVRP